MKFYQAQVCVAIQAIMLLERATIESIWSL